MFIHQQIGIIVEAVKPDKNYYRLRLVDSGSVVTAIPLQGSRGEAVRFEPNDSVIAGYAAGAWFIHGLIPIFALDENSSPRLKALAPGDAFYGSAKTGAGLHITGGLPSVEAGGFDGSGKPRRSSGTYWVPDYDAIMNLCRRFGLNGAAGDMQMLHDDITGETALRIWVRPDAHKNLDGKVARIHMGYHKSPPGATFSITTFPPGADPMAAVKSPEFLMDPEAEKLPFAGQWPKTERDDWQTRYYAMVDGTVIFESAMVPSPSMTPTTVAQANVKILITPEGFIFTDAKEIVTLEAMENLIKLKTNYTMIAGESAIIKAPAIAVIGDVVRIGVVEKSLQLMNINFFNWFANVFLPDYAVHQHISTTPGSPTTGHIPDLPDVEAIREPGLTTNTTAS